MARATSSWRQNCHRGLYVTRKSPSGFAVRESQGSHTTLAFGYRIVAKPFGDRSARLPMVPLRTVSAQEKARGRTQPTFPMVRQPKNHATRCRRQRERPAKWV